MLTLTLYASASYPRTAVPDRIRLSSAETKITLHAGLERPNLVRLASSSGAGWQNRASESLIDHVELHGKRQLVYWRFNPEASQITATDAILVYECKTPRLRLSWGWRVRSPVGPLEHSIRIDNLSSEELWIPLQESLSFDWQVAPGVPLEELWIEKGAGKPSDEGTRRITLIQSQKWEGESSTYAHPPVTQPREIIPWLLVDRPGGRSGWYVGIEFSGRTRITLERDGDSLHGTAGLNPMPGPFRTRLAPGGSFEAPAVFLGAYRGDEDDAGNILRRWVRQVLNNRRTIHDPLYPLLVNNSWGSAMQIDEAAATRMIQASASLGFEMFHLDAGWFRGVGDWYPDPMKFPHGIASIADSAHRLGLRFGLWVDWAQAGLDTNWGALNVNDPQVGDWLVSNPPVGWKPQEFKGITIDIGVPAAHDWALRNVNRLLHDYHLDMLEHDGYLVAQGCDRADHPHAPPDPAHIRRYQEDGALWVESSNSTDVSYHATRSYYDIYSQIREQHPGLLLEICNDGGRMVDFGSAAHGDYFSITDSYDPLSNRRAFYDASFVLPSAMLESYVANWPTPRIENFSYMLRSGMMGWFTLMLDTQTLSADERAATRQALTLYKTKLRPLIREADLYHVSPRPDGKNWDGIEYFDSTRRQGVLFAFHGSNPGEENHWFVLRGLRADRMYRLWFQDESSAAETVLGRDLMLKGVKVSLPVPNSSDLVFLDEVERG
ncbi:MAG: glycoside hydrolase family 36 protein [Bryobacteraceae bacterium]